MCKTAHYYWQMILIVLSHNGRRPQMYAFYSHRSINFRCVIAFGQFSSTENLEKCVRNEAIEKDFHFKWSNERRNTDAQFTRSHVDQIQKIFAIVKFSAGTKCNESTIRLRKFQLFSNNSILNHLHLSEARSESGSLGFYRFQLRTSCSAQKNRVRESETFCRAKRKTKKRMKKSCWKWNKSICDRIIFALFKAQEHRIEKNESIKRKRNDEKYRFLVQKKTFSADILFFWFRKNENRGNATRTRTHTKWD